MQQEMAQKMAQMEKDYQQRLAKSSAMAEKETAREMAEETAKAAEVAVAVAAAAPGHGNQPRSDIVVVKPAGAPALPSSAQVAINILSPGTPIELQQLVLALQKVLPHMLQPLPAQPLPAQPLSAQPPAVSAQQQTQPLAAGASLNSGAARTQARQHQDDQHLRHRREMWEEYFARQMNDLRERQNHESARYSF